MSLGTKIALIAAPILGAAGAGAVLAIATPVFAASPSPAASPVTGVAPGTQQSPSTTTPSQNGANQNCPH